MLRDDLRPVALRGKAEDEIRNAWPAWVESRDREIRARVADGDADSIVHLMLFGTSFTSAPRAGARELAALASDPDAALKALAPRLDAFVAALAAPGGNERLQVARAVIARSGEEPRRWLERGARAVGHSGAQQLQVMVQTPEAMGTIFAARGLSSDTTLTVDHGIERALEAMRDKHLLQPNTIRRVAIVGPGLDFIDKQTGYDFYPQQTIQPFAIVEALLRYGLAERGPLQVTAFDVNPRVLQHIAAARERARTGTGYTLVLPRDLDRPWQSSMTEYWEDLGNWVGEPVAAPPVPAGAGRVEVRSVRVRPDVVLAVTPRDLNVVLQRVDAPGDAPFDLIVATNILLYYDVFEQSLALANIARMLTPDGVLLTNTRMTELPDTPLTATGYTDTTYGDLPGVGATGDRIYWYQKP